MSRSLFHSHEPELWDALHVMADGMRVLRAPDDIDPPTGARVPRKWLPCSAPTCRNVDVVSLACVSFVCSECAAPCESQDCGLMRFEHYSHDNEERHPCEPRMVEEPPACDCSPCSDPSRCLPGCACSTVRA